MSRVLVAASSQYLVHNAAVLTAEPLTMACWFQMTDSSLNQAIMSIGSTSLNFRWQMEAIGGALAARTVAVTNNAVASTGAIVNNTWGHGIAQYASGSSRVAGFNGSLSTAETTVCGTPSSLDRTYLGARFNASVGLFLGGIVGSASVWQAILNADECLSLARGTNPRHIRPNSLRGHWFIDRQGDLVPDLTGNGFHMTVVGSPAIAAPPPISSADRPVWIGRKLAPAA